MQILVAPTEEFIKGAKTYLSADEAAAQTVLSIENPKGFSAGDFIAIGNIGNESTELRRILSVETNTITLVTALSFAHDNNETIQQLYYDQRKFYRSASRTGTFSHLSVEGSPVNIVVDEPEGTYFEDSTGTSASWYKATYYNSYSGLESAVADASPAKAGDTEHYTSIYKIKKEAGFADNPFITSDDVDKYRTWAENKAESGVSMIYSLPFATTPIIFQEIVTLLAAGMLLSEEYGMEADVEISKTGQRKIEMAEKILKEIQDGELTLLDTNKAELTRLTSNKASSSNIYDSSKYDKGELFNVSDETFKFTDPNDEMSSSRR